MRDFLEDAEKALAKTAADPIGAARNAAKQEWPKRFYKTVSVGEAEGGYCILLDERTVKSPGRKPLALPTKEAAEILAAEWDAIEKDINPLLMPASRIVNTAVDGVVENAQAVLEDVVRYAGSDLLCYRAESPQGLVNSQRDAWDPVLEWAEQTLGGVFEVTEGLMPQPQPKETIAAFSAALKKHTDPVVIACLHTFTSLTGSALLAFALVEGHLNAQETWQAAHVDEDWSISQWGEDYDAKVRRDQRWQEFEAANKLFLAVK